MQAAHASRPTSTQQRFPPTYNARFGCLAGQQISWFEPGVPYQFGWVMDQAPVQLRGGEWWVGGGSGLYRFPPSESFASVKTTRPLAVYTTKHGLSSMQVSRVFADSGGHVWVATVNPIGLARWDPASETWRDLAADLANAPGLPRPQSHQALSFAEDRAGNVWIGFGTGLARYRHGVFTLFSAKDGLPPGAIRNILSGQRGRLWLASARSGLIRVDNPVGERPVFTSHATAQGLSSNITSTIAEDVEGRIYVGTGRGLDRLVPETGSVKHFTTADGLVPGEIIAMFRDREGTLWIGTRKGLSRFTPAPEPPPQPPPILITAV